MNIKSKDYDHQGLDYTPYVVDQIKHIEAVGNDKDASKRPAYISNAVNRLVKSELERLGYFADKDTGKVDESKTNCKFNTYVNIMNNYRNAIKSLGFKHHSFELSLSQFVDKFDHIYDSMSELKNITFKGKLSKYLTPNQKIETLRDKMTLLRSAVAKDTEMGKRLLKIKLEHHAFYLFAPISSVVAEKRQQSEDSLKIKHMNRVLINGDWFIETTKKLIEDGIAELSQWVSLKPVPKKDDYDKSKYRSKRVPYTRLAVGLAFASGRRVTEIMRTAKFLPGKIENSVSFSGQLKTKNRHLFEDLSAYDIPVLVDVDLFLKGFDVLRAFGRTEFIEYTNAEGVKVNEKVLSGPITNTQKNNAVQIKYTKALNDRAKIVLNSGEFQFKDTRAIAATVAMHDFNPKQLSSKLFLGEYLGHAKTKNTTYEYYDGFKYAPDQTDSVKMINGSRKDDGNNAEAGGEVKDKEFLAFLEQNSQKVKEHIRAPKWFSMHNWLIDRVKAGLNRLDIMDKVNNSSRTSSGTAALRSIFRKDCIIDNKSVAPASVLSYLTDERGLGLKDDLTWDK